MCMFKFSKGINKENDEWDGGVVYKKQLQSPKKCDIIIHRVIDWTNGLSQ